MVHQVTLHNAFMSAYPLNDLVPLIIEESNYNRQRKSNWSSDLHLRSTSTSVLRLGASHHPSVRITTVGYRYVRGPSISLQSRSNGPDNSTNLTWCCFDNGHCDVDWVHNAHHSRSRTTRRL